MNTPPRLVAASLTGVSRRFGSFWAVKDLDLELPRGQVAGLIGPNGAGKSTALKLLLGMLSPDAGEVRLFGRKPHHSVMKHVGFLPEQRGLPLGMTARHILWYVGEIHGLSRPDRQTRTDAWLEKLGLIDRADEKLDTFSKGMQQKVQLAASLLHEPDLLVMDEPFSGLDPVNQEVFERLFREEADRGASVLMSTHQLDHAERVCDRVDVLVRGRAVLSGALRDIRRAHREDRYRVAFDGPQGWLRGPEVVEVVRDGHTHIVQLSAGASSASLLRRASEADVDLERFEVVVPSLRAIVIDTIRGTPDEGAWDGEEA